MSTAPANAKLVLGPEHNGMLMTPEEFDAVEDYDDTYSYELIHGVLVVNPIPRSFEGTGDGLADVEKMDDGPPGLPVADHGDPLGRPGEA